MNTRFLASKSLALAVGLGAAIALVSCTTGGGNAPAVASLGCAPAQTAKLEAGRALYVGKCTKCHTAEPVRDYSAAQWQGKIIPAMAQKAKLTPEETANVLAYVLAASKAPETH